MANVGGNYNAKVQSILKNFGTYVWDPLMTLPPGIQAACVQGLIGMELGLNTFNFAAAGGNVGNVGAGTGSTTRRSSTRRTANKRSARGAAAQAHGHA